MDKQQKSEYNYEVIQHIKFHSKKVLELNRLLLYTKREVINENLQWIIQFTCKKSEEKKWKKCKQENAEIYLDTSRSKFLFFTEVYLIYNAV